MNRMLLTGMFAAAALAPARVAAQAVSPGDTPTYRFQQLENGMGSSSLADLRGKPVFVEFWGTR